jgi:hypothetical protein
MPTEVRERVVNTARIVKDRVVDTAKVFLPRAPLVSTALVGALYAEVLINPPMALAGGPDHGVSPNPPPPEVLARRDLDAFYRRQMNSTLSSYRYLAQLSINDSFRAGLVDGALAASAIGGAAIGGVYLARRRALRR